MPRQVRIDTPGALHHIMVRGIERRKIFEDNKDKDNFIERLGAIIKDTSHSATPGLYCPITSIFFSGQVIIQYPLSCEGS